MQVALGSQKLRQRQAAASSSLGVEGAAYTCLLLVSGWRASEGVEQ